MGEIDQLARDLVQARSEETDARNRRIQIEEAIIAASGISDSQRMTMATGNGLKLTLSTGYNYKLSKGYDPSIVPTKTTTKVELDVKAYEALQGEAKLQAAESVIITPKKPSVNVAIQ